jgi:DHA1 family multidrug resistance protein-like MFS transporter
MPPWKKSFYAVFVAELLAITGFGTSIPILPFFLQDLGVTEPNKLNFWVGIINSGGSVSLALMAPVWGCLADSYGRRSMLLRSMLGGAAVIFLIGFAVSPGQVLLLRVIQGVVTGTVAAATVLVAGIVPEEEVGFRMGLLHTAIFVGNSLGPSIGGILADVFGLRIAFFATSVLLVAAGLIVKIFVKETFLPRRPDRFRLSSLVPDFRPIFESRSILILLILAGIIQVANSAVVPILPLHVQAISPGNARVGAITGLIMGAAALASAVSAAFMGRISFRLGYAKTLFLGFIAAAILHIPQGLVMTPVFLLVYRTFSSFSLGAAAPVINSLIAGKADKHRQGAIYGVSSSVSALGYAVGPLIGALVAVTAGYSSVFFVTALILGGAAVLTKKYVFTPENR